MKAGSSIGARGEKNAWSVWGDGGFVKVREIKKNSRVGLCVGSCFGSWAALPVNHVDVVWHGRGCERFWGRIGLTPHVHSDSGDDEFSDSLVDPFVEWRFA